MTQTIFPVLRYDNAREAIDWLSTAFGFSLIFSVPESGPMVRHARLGLADNLIMLGSVRDDEANFVSPKTVEYITQALCVYVTDVDTHYEQAKAAGATIVEPLTHTDFGSKEYHAYDLEGHLWIFTTPA